MKSNISNFTKEAKVFLKVYYTTFIAIAVGFLMWNIFSWVSGHEVLIVNKLQNPVVEATK